MEKHIKDFDKRLEKTLKIFQIIIILILIFTWAYGILGILGITKNNYLGSLVYYARFVNDPVVNYFLYMIIQIVSVIILGGVYFYLKNKNNSLKDSDTIIRNKILMTIAGTTSVLLILATIIVSFLKIINHPLSPVIQNPVAPQSFFTFFAWGIVILFIIVLLVLLFLKIKKK
jgi:hypothetical protein